MSVKPGAWIDGIAIEGIAPFAWRLTRGVAPYAQRVVASDGRFDDLTNPVRLTFRAPSNAFDSGESVKQFENLYIVERGATSTGDRHFLLVDVRWLLARSVLNANYNIKLRGEFYRDDSLRKAFTPWSVVDAVRDAIKTASGLTVEVDARDLKDERLTAQLPNNLGNAPGGGWLAAKPREFVPTMLGDAGALTVTSQGKLRVVSKGLPYIDGDLLTKDVGKVDGDLIERATHWQYPRELRIHFPKMYSSEFRVNLPTRLLGKTSSLLREISPPKEPFELEIENVIPTFESVIQGVEPRFVTVEEFLADPDVSKYGLSVAKIRERFTQPRFIDVSKFTQDQVREVDAIEDLIRRWFWRGWRIVNNKGRRVFANIQLGELRDDGGVRALPAQADYVAVRRSVDTSNVFQRAGQVSVHHVDEASPFYPQWIAPDIFELVAIQPPPSIAHYYLGQFTDPVVLGRMSQPGSPLYETDASLLEDFTLRVVWSGLYSGSTQAHFKKPRTYPISRTMFPGGDGIVDAPGAITANWQAMTQAEANRRVTQKLMGGGLVKDGKHFLLNFKDLNERVDYLRKEFFQSYKQTRSGQLSYAGLDVLVKNQIEVGGDIHEIGVLFGAQEPYTVTTEIAVLPEVRPIRAKPLPELTPGPVDS